MKKKKPVFAKIEDINKVIQKGMTQKNPLPEKKILSYATGIPSPDKNNIDQQFIENSVSPPPNKKNNVQQFIEDTVIPPPSKYNNVSQFIENSVIPSPTKDGQFPQLIEKSPPPKVNTELMKLDTFLPIQYCEEVNVANHPHYINLYSMNRRFLTITSSNSKILPKEMKMPYSEGFPILNNLTFVKILQSDPTSTELQVILYKGINDKKYVLKRFLYGFCMSYLSASDYTELDNFLQKRYLEYSLMQQFYACPHSSTPIFFNIVLLKEISWITSELMMDYAGEPIEKFNFETSEQIYDIIWQLTETLRFLEDNKLEHNDIKRQNVLIDNILGIPILKVIDFDIGTNQSATVKTNKGMGLIGHTPFYSSPEIFNLKDANYTGSEEISPFKSQMYSVGVLVLESMKFFEKLKLNERLFATFKTSPQKYCEVEKKIKEFALMNKDDPLKTNLIEICSNCIAYDPSKRPTAYELQSVLKNLFTKTPIMIVNEFLNMQTVRLNLINENKEKLVSLEAEIEKYETLLKTTNQEIEEGKSKSKLPFNKVVASEKIFNNDEISKLNDQLYNFITINQNLDKEINNLKSNIYSALEEKNSLIKEIEELKHENESYLSQISELNKEVTEKSEKVQLSINLNNKINLQEDEINQLRNLNSNLNKEKEEKEKKINQLLASLLDTQEKIREVEKEIQGIDKKVDNINEELKQKKGKIEQNLKEQDALNIKIDCLLIDQTHLTERYNQLIHIVKEKLDAKTRIIFGNSDINDELDKRILIDDFLKFISENVNFKQQKGNAEGENKNKHENKNKNKNEENKELPSFEKPIIPQSHKLLGDNQGDLNQKGRKTIFLKQHIHQLDSEKDSKSLNVPEAHIDFPFQNYMKMFQRFKDKLSEMGIIKDASSSLEELIKKVNIKTCIDKINTLYKYCNPIFIEKELKEKKVKSCSGVYVNEKCTFSGQMADQIPEGKGVLTYKNGITYSTAFTKGRILDFVIIEKENDIYVGIFNFEFLDGIGFKFLDYKLNYNQNKYEIYFGYFRGLDIDGYGKMWNSDGETFTGDWYRNYREGSGELCSKTGEKYIGDWSKNMKNGIATSTYQNGDAFIGGWKDNKKEGKGKYTLKDGSYYDGYYHNDQRHGFGSMKMNNGGNYQGNFEKGKYNGVGKYTWPNGQYYEGEFIDGKKNGKGKLVGKTGEILEGIWNNDSRVGEFVQTVNGVVSNITYSHPTKDENESEYDARECVIF